MYQGNAIKTVRGTGLIQRLKDQKWLFLLMLPALLATLFFFLRSDVWSVYGVY